MKKPRSKMPNTKTTNTFSEQTLVPVSFLVVLAGFCFWLATLSARTTAHGETLDELTVRNHERDQVTVDMLQRIERIDTKVNLIYESVRKHK